MDIFKPGEFAKKIGRSVSTLQKWDRAGKLKARRTSTHRRFYTDEDFRFVMKLEPASKDRVSYTYARTSSQSQKTDLESQKQALQIFCQAAGISVHEHLSDIGSGLNYKRKNFTYLMEQVEKREVACIVIAHKDRLVRFGFEWFENFCKKHGTRVIVMNNESLSPEEEMTQDLMNIIHCFSSRLYGLRKYKKDIRKILIQKEKNSDRESM
jgi:putative resolvase